MSKKIVSLLNKDIKEHSNVKILIDFNPPVIKRKKITNTKRSSDKQRKITNYFDPWLSIHGEFSDYSPRTSRADRTKFKLNIAASYRNTSYWKTTRSGKRKWVEPTALTRYPFLYSKLKTFKISQKSMQLKVYLPQKSPTLIYQTVVSMFLSLYQILNLARTLSKVSK